MASEFKKKKNRGRKAVRIILIVLAVLVVAGGVYGILKIRQARTAVSAIAVQTATAETATITQTIDGSGNLEAAEVQGVLVPIGVTVDKVQVEVGDAVKQGDVLATVNTASVAGAIADVDDSLQAVKNSLNESGISSYEREELTARRDELQAVRDELVALHDNPVITATADGIIGSIGVSDGTEITAGTSASAATSAAVSGVGMAYSAEEKPLVAVSLSADDPDGGEEPPEDAPVPDEDFSDLTELIPVPETGKAQSDQPIETPTYDGRLTWDPSGEEFLPKTVYTANVQLTADEGYYFTMDQLAALKQSLAGKNITLAFDESTTILPAKSLTFTLTFPETEDNSGDTPDEPTPSPAATDDPASSEITTGTDYSSILSSLYGSSSYYSSGTDYTGVSSVTGKTYTDTYNSHEAETFTITLTENVKLKINVDELDVLQVKEGQTAVVTIDAIDGAEYEGTIQKVSATASSSTGSTKYAAEILLPMDENMRLGMSASVSIVTGEAADVLTLPMEALQESVGETFVYTSVDENGMPASPVTVTIGVADGTTAEILSGLNEGDTVYYTRILSADDTDVYYY